MSDKVIDKTDHPRWICDGCGLPRNHPSHREPWQPTAEQQQQMDRLMQELEEME